MGIFKSLRVVVDDLASSTSGPFRRKNNEYIIIGKVDRLMIGPGGTSFSRPIGETKGKGFWGVDQNIAFVSGFITPFSYRHI